MKVAKNLKRKKSQDNIMSNRKEVRKEERTRVGRQINEEGKSKKGVKDQKRRPFSIQALFSFQIFVFHFIIHHFRSRSIEIGHDSLTCCIKETTSCIGTLKIVYCQHNSMDTGQSQI